MFCLFCLSNQAFGCFVCFCMLLEKSGAIKPRQKPPWR
nr:MAG TPA: hypothetical protein [Caudoviricetes sp.]DAK93362.1 MAG TPA: hypothetical protein [Caudoviricetes sp.]